MSEVDPLAGIKQLIINLTNRLKQLVEAILYEIDQLVTDLVHAFEGLVQQVIAQISAAVESLANLAEALFNRVADAIATLMEDLARWGADLFDQVTTYLVRMYQDAAAAFTNLSSQVSAFLQNSTAAVQGFLVGLFDTAQARLGELVGLVRDKASSLLQAVTDQVTALVDRAKEVVDTLSSGVERFISEVVDNVGGSLRDLLETISNLPEALAALKDSLLESAKENIADPLKELPQAIAEFFTGTPAEAADGEYHKVASFLEAIAVDPNRSTFDTSQWYSLFSETVPNNKLARWALSLVIAATAFVAVPASLASANANRELERIAIDNPYRAPAPAQAVDMFWRSLVERAEAQELVQRSGISAKYADLVIETGSTIPPEGEAVAWWMRGLVSDEGLATILKGRGWTDEHQALLVAASYQLPPVQDLVTMAVREVFSPAVAERFGQYDDFPQAFEDEAAKIGVSPEWARRYWAAHWALPSPQMGFEMFQRGIIDQADLVVLLRALDVMPYWREKLIALSYSTITRVDVRRMYSIGVLNRDQVKERYQQIGYSPEDAELLTQFTEKTEGASTADNPDQVRDLTRSNIVGFYSDGLLSRSDAEDQLVGIGYSEDAASLFLDASDLDQVRQERKAELQLIIDLVLSGGLGIEDAQARLAERGFEAGEVAAALRTIEREQLARVKLPSRADLDRMIKHQLIDGPTYLDTMGRLGYSLFWAEKYQALAIGGAADAGEQA